MSYATKIEELVAERDEANCAMSSALRLVADLRWALGDEGRRMQAELIEYAKQTLKDAERYRWLRAHWARVVTDTVWGGVDEPRGVKAIELGSNTIGSVDSDSLDRALDRCMAELVLPNGPHQR